MRKKPMEIQKQNRSPNSLISFLAENNQKTNTHITEENIKTL